MKQRLRLGDRHGIDTTQFGVWGACFVGTCGEARVTEVCGGGDVAEG